MDRNITIKLGTTVFHLKASSPEMERNLRLAAEDINAMLAKYDQRFPDKEFSEKLAFVTLQETIGRLTSLQKLSEVRKEIEALTAETTGYLSDIEK